VISALVTPFSSGGDVNHEAFQRHVQALSEAGIHGYFVNGTTAEGAYLSTEEKRVQLRIARETAGAGQIICSAAIQPSTEAVLVEMEALEPEEPDYVVAVPPFYYAVSQEGIYEHFRRIAQASSAPLIVYDIPQHTQNAVGPALRRRLVREGICVGIKDSTGNFPDFSRLLLEPELGHVAWIQGNDVLDCASLQLGAAGMVSGLSNVAPEVFVRLYEASRQGDHEAMCEAQRRINRLADIGQAAGGSPVSGIKAALSLEGHCSHQLRVPGDTATESQKQAVGAILSELGLEFGSAARGMR
jgi:4-hydroxy-tetrahydrodipicolinate synthase